MEMPGLQVNLKQAQLLWGLYPTRCKGFSMRLLILGF